MKVLKSIVKDLLPPFVRYQLELARYRDEMEKTGEECIRLLRQYVKGKTFIDVGANAGIYSYHLQEYAEHVVAFEPIPFLAERLGRFNRSVEVHNCALSNVAGRMSLYIPYAGGQPIFTRGSLNRDANPGFDLEQAVVPVRRLDEFHFTNVGAVKIDVEGHENEVLLGARETITINRPVLFIEIEERHHPGRSLEIIESLVTLGYEPYYVNEKNRLVEAGDFDFARLQDPSNLKTPFGAETAVYLNNFVFLPRAQDVGACGVV